MTTLQHRTCHTHRKQNKFGDRSDLMYDIKNPSHPRKLTEGHTLNQGDETTSRKQASRADTLPGPSGQLYQPTGHRNLRRSKKIVSEIKSDCSRTLNLESDIELRKSLAKIVIKIKAPAGLPQPPTPHDLKRKQLKGSK